MTPCDEGRWLWWSFLPILKLSLLELFMSILSPISHSFFLILLWCHLFLLSFVNLGILFGPSAPFIISFLQKISGQHIPKGIYNWFKARIVLCTTKGHPLCYNIVGFNILITIESLSYVLNNVPLLFTTTSNF